MYDFSEKKVWVQLTWGYEQWNKFKKITIFKSGCSWKSVKLTGLHAYRNCIKRPWSASNFLKCDS